jgi:hypothetical protein
LHFRRRLGFALLPLPLTAARGVMMFGIVVAWIALAAATSSSVEIGKWSTEKGFDVNSPIGFSQVTFELPLNADPAKPWFG